MMFASSLVLLGAACVSDCSTGRHRTGNAHLAEATRRRSRRRAAFLIPDVEAARVQPNRFPIIGAHQAHPLRGRDCEAAPIAGLAQPGAMP